MGARNKGRVGLPAVLLAMRAWPALGVALCALEAGAGAGVGAGLGVGMALGVSADAAAAAPKAEARPAATAAGTGGSGSNIGGRIVFTQQADGLAVEADLSGLPPGAHAMHIHAGGACGDGHAPGAHFEPAAEGGASKGGKAAGDLPSLVADQSGRAVLKAVLPALTVSAGAASVLGRTIMIHAHGDGEHAGHAGHGGHNHAIACAPIRALR